MKISVVMPVYNGEKYLKEAIDSVLSQTFTDYEFIIIDDCSTDGTSELIKTYKDSRIRCIRNETNLGVALSLNRGLDEARGEYIARMDADDISLPDRFAKQIAIMDGDRDIAVCGCDIIEFTDDGHEERKFFEYDCDKIKIGLLFNSALAHPTVMIRKAVLDDNRLRYDPEYEKAEDFELWTRIAAKYKLFVISEPLLRYRIHSLQVSNKHNEKQRTVCRRIRLNSLNALIGSAAEKYISVFDAYCNGEINSESEYSELVECFKLMIARNKSYNSNKLKSELYLIKNSIALNNGYNVSVQDITDLLTLMRIKASRMKNRIVKERNKWNKLG